MQVQILSDVFLLDTLYSRVRSTRLLGSLEAQALLGYRWKLLGVS
jgi:hypothetical protein